MTTYFVVQTFEMGKRGALIADPPLQLASRLAAERSATRFAERKAGVVAFQRTGDPQTGEFADAEIIVSYGNVPIEEDA